MDNKLSLAHRSGKVFRSIESLKRLAKETKRAQGITHTQALDTVAKDCGFAHWAQLMKESEKNGQTDSSV